MAREVFLDDADDDTFDDELLAGEFDKYDGLVNNLKGKKRRPLDARRKIERLMEQRRMRENDEDYF